MFRCLHWPLIILCQSNSKDYYYPTSYLVSWVTKYYNIIILSIKWLITLMYQFTTTCVCSDTCLPDKTSYQIVYLMVPSTWYEDYFIAFLYHFHSVHIRRMIRTVIWLPVNVKGQITQSVHHHILHACIYGKTSLLQALAQTLSCNVSKLWVI